MTLAHGRSKGSGERVEPPPRGPKNMGCIENVYIIVLKRSRYGTVGLRSNVHCWAAQQGALLGCAARRGSCTGVGRRCNALIAATVLFDVASVRFTE